MLRLTALGDRLGGGPAHNPKRRREGTLAREAAWAAAAFCLAYLAGLRLEQSSGGNWFGGGLAAAAIAASPLSWAVLGYLALEVGEWARSVAEARRGRRPFVSSSVVTAAFLTVCLILAGLLLLPSLVYGLWLAGKPSPGRAALAVSLLLAKQAAELLVLWVPWWGHHLDLPGRKPVKGLVAAERDGAPR